MEYEVFFCCTEYQVIQAHVINLFFNHNPKSSYLLILDDQRRNDEIIAKKYWKSIIFLPKIENKNYFMKIFGNVYKKTHETYKSKTLELQKCYSHFYYANDEKMETAILLNILKPKIIYSLEDGTGNYIENKISIKKSIFRIIIRIIKSIVFFISFREKIELSTFLGQKKTVQSFRMRPKNKDEIGLSILFNNHIKKYLCDLSFLYNANIDYNLIETIVFVYSLNDKVVNKILRIKNFSYIFIKSHPAMYLQNELYLKKNKIQNINLLPNIYPAELLPYVCPNLREIILTTTSTVQQNYKVLFPQIKQILYY